MKMRFGPRFPYQARVLGPAVAAGALALTSIISAQSFQTTSQRPATPPAAPGATRIGGDVARGDYLVNSVAMCVQCHSPRDQRGNLIADKKLTGASIPVRGP